MQHDKSEKIGENSELERKEIDNLIDLIVDIIRNEHHKSFHELMTNFRQQIQSKSATVLIGVIAYMNSSPGDQASMSKALREAIISELDRKNTVVLAGTIERLDRAASKLNTTMLWLTAAGVCLAMVQIVLAVVQGFIAS